MIKQLGHNLIIYVLVFSATICGVERVHARLVCGDLFTNQLDRLDSANEILGYGSLAVIREALKKRPGLFLRTSIKSQKTLDLDMDHLASYPGVLNLLERFVQADAGSQKKMMGILLQIAKINKDYEENQRRNSAVTPMTDQQRTALFIQKLQREQSAMWDAAIQETTPPPRFNPYFNRHSPGNPPPPPRWSNVVVRGIMEEASPFWVKLLENPEFYKNYLP